MFYIGDIHSDWNQLTKIIRGLSESNISNENIIQVGDFGIGFQSYIDESYNLSVLDQLLKENENMLHVIAGNHDSKQAMERHNKSDGLTNIKFYTKNELIVINNKKILLIPGGVSIDRIDRLIDRSYWADEEIEIYTDINVAEIIVSHVPKNILRPPSDILNYYMNRDKVLNKSLNRENDILDIVEQNTAGVKYWISGHMHYYKNEKINNINYIILAQNQIYELK